MPVRSFRGQVILDASSKSAPRSRVSWAKTSPSSSSTRCASSSLSNAVLTRHAQFLDYFFTGADAQFYKSLGLNCIRIAFNYRHFEDDMNPRVLKQSGFKHLDRVIELCAQQGIYTVLDLHTAPGGQNCDWHSDSPTHVAAFWEHKDFQDRTVWLWGELAKHYKDNPYVAPHARGEFGRHASAAGSRATTR